jgi:hypothetical protein
MKMTINGRNTTPFAADTLSPLFGRFGGNSGPVINFSRHTYGRPKDLVKLAINDWLENKRPISEVRFSDSQKLETGTNPDPTKTASQQQVVSAPKSGAQEPPNSPEPSKLTLPSNVARIRPPITTQTTAKTLPTQPNHTPNYQPPRPQTPYTNHTPNLPPNTPTHLLANHPHLINNSGQQVRYNVHPPIQPRTPQVSDKPQAYADRLALLRKDHRGSKKTDNPEN